MRTLLALVACLALCSCVTGRLSPGGEGFDIGISYPASADRVAQVEQSLQRARSEVDASIEQTRADTSRLVQDAATNLAGAVESFDRRTQEMGATAQAQREQLEQELQSFDLFDLLGEDVLNWVLAMLGIGGLGTIGATATSRKRRGVSILTGKAKAAVAPKP